jgi:hypothetical protein
MIDFIALDGSERERCWDKAWGSEMRRVKIIDGLTWMVEVNGTR